MNRYYLVTEGHNMGLFGRSKHHKAHADEVDKEIALIKDNFDKQIKDVKLNTRKAREAAEIILEAESKGDGVLNTFLATGGDKRL